MGGKRSKQVGKEGESELKALLITRGWLIADKETQGLAGDDLFARDPSGKWWSIEAKKTAAMYERFITQARTQAEERALSLVDELKKPQSIAKMLAITFDKRDWMVCWKPRLLRLYSHYFVVFTRDNIEVWKDC